MGMLGAMDEGVVQFLMIPTIAAAPDSAMIYSFGGSFSFLDPFSGETMTYHLYPVELTVNPSPNLRIDYFVQRNIISDDPLTDTVEPAEPAEIAMMISNVGAGDAKKVYLESSQPQIVDNPNGLLIQLDMIGSSMNGQPRQLCVTDVPFGTIRSYSTAVAEWYYVSNLMTRVIHSTPHLIHNSSYGNPDLSLVTEINAHDLIKAITAYGSLDDGINDFFVNEITDFSHTPDMIYFSHGGKTNVKKVLVANTEGTVSEENSTVLLNVNPIAAGWNYACVDDPAQGLYELLSCTRDDGQEIPLSNVWVSHVTMFDDDAPVHENKLHIVDTVSDNQTVTYTLVYAGNPSRPPIGAIDGLFSVSNTQKVYFSQGNLQYQASTDTWRFATNQWDYVGGTAVGEHNGNVSGSSNSDISPTYDGWIDLFGWGTSGWDNGNTYYHPWDINADNDGTLFGPPGLNSLVDEYANSDWGVYNPISNGGNKANQWRSLTYWEWNYLLNTRTTPSGVRYAKAQVNGVNGLVLVPDKWDTSIYELRDVNTSTASFDSNVIGLTEWKNTLESSGAVFLPAAGVRFNGTRLYYLNSQGAYWFSTCHGIDEFYACQVVVSNDEVGNYSGYRSTGLSIRLVQTMQDNSTYTINTMCSPSMGGTVTGAGTFNEGEICTLTATANEGCTFVNWTKNDVVVSTEAIYSFTVMENAIYVANFSVDEFRFVIPGNWSDAANWSGGALPGANDAVFIDANCSLNRDAEVAELTITSGKTLTLRSGKTLTVTGNLTNSATTGLVIEDGAQLVHASENVAATVKKSIAGYGTDESNWCLIACPMVESIVPSIGNGLLSGNYDLYSYSPIVSDGLEWRNYKQDNFMLLGSDGYLYANETGAELSFGGILVPSDSHYVRNVNYYEGNSSLGNGWALLGNPFVCECYLVDANGNPLTIYKMNAEGTGLDAVESGPIAPFEGFFYYTPVTGNVYFSKTAPSKGGAKD